MFESLLAPKKQHNLNAAQDSALSLPLFMLFYLTHCLSLCAAFYLFMYRKYLACLIEARQLTYAESMEPWSIHRARVDSSWRALSIEINLYTKFANLLPCTHTQLCTHTVRIMLGSNHAHQPITHTMLDTPNGSAISLLPLSILEPFYSSFSAFVCLNSRFAPSFFIFLLLFLAEPDSARLLSADQQDFTAYIAACLPHYGLTLLTGL